jgi:hypothetical protein
MPPAERPVVEQRDLLARRREEVRGRDAGDAGADHADVDVEVFLEGREFGSAAVAAQIDCS